MIANQVPRHAGVDTQIEIPQLAALLGVLVANAIRPQRRLAQAQPTLPVDGVAQRFGGGRQNHRQQHEK